MSSTPAEKRTFDNPEWRKEAAKIAENYIQPAEKGRPFTEILQEFRQIGIVWVHRSDVGEVIENLSMAGFHVVVMAGQRKYNKGGVMLQSLEHYKMAWIGADKPLPNFT